MMIQSMTGYGKAEALLEGGKLTIEIRSVNGKNAEISIKSSLLPKEKEMQLRKTLADRLQRGTIDVFLNWEPNAGTGARTVNKELALDYFRQIEELGREIGAVNLPLNDPNYLLATLLRMPDVLDSSKHEVITEQNWPLVENAFYQALDAITVPARARLFTEMLRRAWRLSWNLRMRSSLSRRSASIQFASVC